MERLPIAFAHTRRWLWTALKFIGRWLGPAIIVLALYLYFFPPMPLGDSSASAALAGGLVMAIACQFMRAPERRPRKRVFAVIALVAIAYGGWGVWSEYSSYRTEELVIDNRGARLAATLYLPDRPGKAPGIVWIHGSGPATRGLTGTFARHFARNGYAFLVFDKRGVGQSTGRYGGGTDREICPENFELLASDGAAALTLLAGRPEVQSDKVGFVGVSQAGWITPRAAVMSGKAAFMLLFTAPTNTAQEIVRLERLRIGSPEGNDADSVFAAFMPGGRDVPEGMNVDQAFGFAQSIPGGFPCPDFDPMLDLRGLDIPGLWVLGKEDWMVPSGHTIENLKTLRELGKPYEYADLSGGYHALLFAPKRQTRGVIDGWLAKVTAQKR